MKKYKVLLLLLFCFTRQLQAQSLDAFVEYGATVHTGENTPMWQMSNQHGFSSLNNHTYLRGATFYRDTLGTSWRFGAGIDLGVAAGFTSTFILQQAYADIRYKWVGLWAGSREISTDLLNNQLSSGGLVWSGNARPIPQVCFGILDYVRLAPGVQLKAQVSFGWFTDGGYQENHAGEHYSYVKRTKFHHKSFYLRFGRPNSHWGFDMGMRLDDQFGGYATRGIQEGDLGNSWKDYVNALITKNEGEGVYFAGNYVGSEHFKLTYRNNDYSFAVYLENYFDDFSGMGKLNGIDGLWGLEYKTTKRQAINGFVLEYYQSTDQSGPLHGLDFSVVKKTGGADNYYNHVVYPGWSHGGMTMANPLIASPIYNKDGNLAFKYNRVRAVHLGWSGDIAKEWTYRAKLSFNRTWGTPFEPTPEVLENFSTFAEVKYIPQKWNNWNFTGSIAFDIGNIYGDNLGFQLKVRKAF